MANKDIFGPGGVDKEFFEKAVKHPSGCQPKAGEDRPVSHHYRPKKKPKTRRPSASEHQALVEKHAALLTEHDALVQEMERRVANSIDEYEAAVLVKLTDVAEAHKSVTKENSDLKVRLDEALAKVKEQEEAVRTVTSTTNANETVVSLSDEAIDRLQPGDEVYLKVTGEGPFVLVEHNDEAIVEWSNPDSRKPNCFRVGQSRVHGAWLMRCRDGSFRTQPDSVLTKDKPQGRFNADALKAVLGSKILGHMIQFAAWGTVVYLLAVR